jgi:hypothetical protein
MQASRCFSCGALVQEIDGPVHRYMDSSPGCWAAFGEVLAREYSDWRYTKNHRLTVDAYAVQHPGKPSPQTIQSVAVHLTSLYLVLERGMSHQEAAARMQALTKHKAAFFWLEPPATLGSITVRDVLDVESAEAHLHTVERWAHSAWEAWHERRDQIRQWAVTLLRD